MLPGRVLLAALKPKSNKLQPKATRREVFGSICPCHEGGTCLAGSLSWGGLVPSTSQAAACAAHEAGRSFPGEQNGNRAPSFAKPRCASLRISLFLACYCELCTSGMVSSFVSCSISCSWVWMGVRVQNRRCWGCSSVHAQPRLAAPAHSGEILRAQQASVLLSLLPKSSPKVYLLLLSGSYRLT